MKFPWARRIYGARIELFRSSRVFREKRTANVLDGRACSMHIVNRDVPYKLRRYDVITCLEMSEHIGVRDYQKFAHRVRSLLKDDGIFYLQIAGLRRNWQYEDLFWGLFMNKYVFPGADASCPLYWDVEQLERAGIYIY